MLTNLPTRRTTQAINGRFDLSVLTCKNRAAKMPAPFHLKSSHFLRLVLTVLVFTQAFNSVAQTSSQYTFSTVATASLALDKNANTVDMSTGTTSLVGSGSNNGVSPSTSIGFSFTFMGTVYTAFTASANGGMRLGGNIASGTIGTSFPVSSQAILAPYLGDLNTHSSGKVHYKLFGTAPNRTAVIEFLNMGINFNSSTANGTFQVRLYEQTNVIEYVYGAMSVGSTSTSGSTTADSRTVIIGFSSTSGNNNEFTVNQSSPYTTSTTATEITNTNSATGAIAGLNSAADGSRRSFTFTPTSAYHAQFISMNLGSASWCAGETRNVTVTVKNIGTATWTNSSPDVNIGLKWNLNGSNWTDYYIRTDANGLAPGATQTYTLSVTASDNIGAGYTTPLAAGTNNITFDVVKEADCWFGDNGGSCGPGNLRYTSANQTIVAAPTAVAGTAINTCSGSGAVNITAGSSATNAATTTWTSSGTGTFTNPNSLTTATYSPSPADITAGSVTLTLTSTPNSPCAANATSNKTLTIFQAPTATAGGSQTICQNGTATVSGATSGNGTIAWTENGVGSITSGATTLTPIYTAAAGDAGHTVTLTMTVSNSGCTAATATYTVFVNASATAAAGTAITTCSTAGAINITAGSSASNNAGITWTSNGTGTFANANSLTLATYDPSPADISAGTVALTLTATGNTGCSNATSNKNFVIKLPPTATAGGNQAICQNGTATVSGATSSNGTIAWTENGAGSITAGATTLTPTYTAAAGDAGNTVTLTMTVSNSPCTAATATYTVFVNAAATAAAGTAIVTCANSGAVNITAGSSASNNAGVTWTSNGTGTFTNANSLTLATYDPSPADIAAGSRTLTLTATGNTGCVNATSNKTITINAIPTTTGVTICQGTASAALTSSYTCPDASPVSTVFNVAGAGATSGTGTAWTTPGNVVSNNNVYATVSGTGTAFSQSLNATGFGFSGLIPSNATIKGIQVNISRFRSGGFSGEIQDNSVKLLKAGTATGNNNGATSTNWPTGETVANYGTTTDLWGTTWSVAQVTASNFGVALIVDNTSGSFSRQANVDYIEISITYTVPGVLNWYTISSGGTAIGSGSSFNPVGVLNSGLPNTNTAGTTIYYAECATLTGCRTPTSYVITAAPAAPISGGDQTVCSNGSPTQTLTASATGGTITWYNAATNGSIVTPTQVGVGTHTYYAQAFDGSCNSLTRTAVTLTINPVPVAVSGNQTVCSDGTLTQTLTATATGGTITWYDAATGGNVVASPTQVGVGTSTYYAEAFDGTCTSLSRAVSVLTINPVPNAPVSGGDQTVCENGNPTQTLTATATGGTITWYNAASNGSVVTPTQVGVGTSTYYAQASDGTCSSLTRTAVILTINAAPAAPTASNQTVCSDGTLTQTLTATATGGTITWYDAATGGNVVTTPEQVGVGSVTYYAESFDGTCSSLTRTAVVLTINPVPAAPVSGGDQTVCENGNPTQTLTATATGGTITWYDAAINGNVVTPTQVGVGTSTYYAEASDGTCSSLTRTAVTLTIIAAPAAPISGGDQTVCEDGNPTQTLTATATGGTITWYDAATGGNVVATPTQIGAGTVTYYAESFDGTCSSVTRTAVTLTITAAPVAIASNQTVCSDGTLTQTLTATATGGTITWYDAAVNGNVVTTPEQVGVGSVTYYAEASDGICISLSRTAVTLTINPVPAAPVSGGDQTVCEDGNPTQTLTATATGGTITWYDAATNGNVVTPTQVGAGTVTYYAESSDGTCSSLTRTAVTLTITAAPAAPTASNQTVCSDGTLTQTLTATATGGTITWYDAATGGNVVTTPEQVGVGSVTFYAESFDGTCTSLTRTAVVLTINPVPAAPVSGGDQTVCENGNPTQTLTATATGGTITWYDAAINGNVVTPTQVGVGTSTYYAEASDGTCSSLTRTAVTLTINAAPAAPVSGGDQTVCEDGNPTQTLTATATGGTITWYDAATGGNVVATPTQIGAGTVTYYAESSDGTCSSLTRTAVILTINAAPAAPTASNQTVCEDGNPTQTLTATATGGTIAWYDAATNGNVVTPIQVGVGTSTYYAEASDGTCSSLTRTAVTLTITAAPAAPTASNQTVCSDGTLTQTLTATATGGTITWYDAATGGNVVTTPEQVGVGSVTYYAESFDGTCTSLTRTAVVLTINPVPAAPVSGGDQTVCENGNPTQTLTATATGGTITWYDAAINGNVVTPTQVGVGTSTYYAEASDGTCSSLTRTAVTLTINAAPAAPVSGGDQTVCEDGNPTQTLTATATGGTITWYDAATNGNVVTPVQVGIGTSTYYAESSDGTCSSLTRTAVILTINAAPAAPTASNQTVCSDGTLTQTLTATATGGTITWYDAATGGNVVGSPVQTGVGTSIYYAESFNGTCTSLTRTTVVLTINPVPNAPVSGGDQTVCSDGTLTQTLTATATGGTITWYDAATNGNVVTPVQVGVGTSTYYAEASDGTCSSLTRTAVTLTINPLPATATLNVVQPNCVTATGSITVTAPTGVGFEYNIGAGFQSSPVFSPLTANTYSITVKNNFGCTSLTPAVATINPQPFVPGAPVVNGIVNVCPYIGTNDPLTYTAFVPGATSYNWILPPNVTLQSGSGTGSIVVTIDPTFTSGQPNKQIRVTAVSECGVSAQTVFYLLAQFPSTPGAISGPVNICSLIGTATTATYTINKVTAATSYGWTTPPIGIGSVVHPNGSGVNDTVIVVTYASNYAPGSITVTAVNGCGTSGSVRSLFIPRTSASTPGLISGPTNVCAYIAPNGAEATYKINAVPGATSYNWNVPPGSVISHVNLPGVNDTVITVRYPAGFSSGSISVSAANGCGTSSLRSLGITKLNPATPSVIDVIQTGFCPSREYSYTIIGMPANATSVQWTIPTAQGAVLVSQTSTSITVSYPATAVAGTVTVQSFNNCGSSTIRVTQVRLPACPPDDPGKGNNTTLPIAKAGKQTVAPVQAETMDVKIFPNPSVSNFNLQVLTAGKGTINVRILDIQGREIKHLTVLPYQTISIGADLKAGSYFVETKQGAEVKTTKMIKF